MLLLNRENDRLRFLTQILFTTGLWLAWENNVVIAFAVHRSPKFCTRSNKVGVAMEHLPWVSTTATRTSWLFVIETGKQDDFELLSPIPVSPIDRFHADMRRVLHSRQSQLGQTESSNDATDSLTNRRNRPPVLTSDIDGAERVLAMLQHMVSLGVANDVSFAIAMEAFLRRGRNRWKSTATNDNKQIICAADPLESLLAQLEDYYQDGPIPTSTYNLVLHAFANCATPRGDRDYAAKADQLLLRMQAQSLTSVESLVHVLHAWAWQQANLQPGACAERANQLLDIIVQETDDLIVQLQCHDWVLEAWSKSGSHGSALRADENFRRMKELQQILFTGPGDTGQASTPPCLPNAQSYANVVLAWSKSHDESERRDALAASAQRAHELLKELIGKFKAGAFTDGSEPELIAFNSVITAWARLGRPDKCEQVLWMMDEIRPLCRSLIPDVKTYNSVLHAHVKGPNKTKALEKAISLVQRMEENCSEQPAIRPDSFTYNTLMKAWIQSGHDDSAPQVERILLKMQALWEAGNGSVRPTTRNFNVVLNAYAKSNDRIVAAKKAHDLLRQMTKMSSSSNSCCRPDIISYTTVIECYSKSSHPNASEIALKLLQEAFDAYENQQHEQNQPYQQQQQPPSMMSSSSSSSSTNNYYDPYEQMPNLRTFTMVILALAKCPRPGNAIKARALLTQLLDLYYNKTGCDVRFRPNQYPFNYVINCAANTVQKSTSHHHHYGDQEANGEMDAINNNQLQQQHAFQIATQTFQEMKRHNVMPDSYTYAFWIKACNNLLPLGSDLHTKCVSFAFEQCKQDGLVTNEVLNRLQQGVDSSLLRTLFELDKNSSNGDEIHDDDIPWSTQGDRGVVGYVQVGDLPSAWSQRTRTQQQQQRRTRNNTTTRQPAKLGRNL